MYGFDDRDAETLIARWIDKCLGQLVDGLQVVVVDARQDVQSVCHTEFLCRLFHALGVFGASSHHNKMNVFRQLGKGVYSQSYVLAFLYRSHVQYESGR